MAEYTEERSGEEFAETMPSRTFAAGAVQGHAPPTAVGEDTRAERDPRRSRRWIGRVHHLALHRLQPGARAALGRPSGGDGPVLPEHGDRALHAGHRRDRRLRLRALLEALGAHLLRLRVYTQHLPRVGHERGDHLRLPRRVRRGRRALHHHHRAHLAGDRAHHLAGRLPDAREGRVLQGGPDVRVPVHRDLRCPRVERRAGSVANGHGVRTHPADGGGADHGHPERARLRGCRRGKQPGAEQLDPGQRLRHGGVRPEDRLPDHGRAAGRARDRLDGPSGRGEPRPVLEVVEGRQRRAVLSRSGSSACSPSSPSP